VGIRYREQSGRLTHRRAAAMTALHNPHSGGEQRSSGLAHNPSPDTSAFRADVRGLWRRIGWGWRRHDQPFGLASNHLSMQSQARAKAASGDGPVTACIPGIPTRFPARVVSVTVSTVQTGTFLIAALDNVISNTRKPLL
jgi:hypothetical protein